MSKVIHCTSCGKKLLSYEGYGYERKFGSPLKECKKCGRQYIDPRYHELAVEGIPLDLFHIPSYLFLIVIGCLIAWRGKYLLGLRQFGVPDEVQWVVPCLFMIVGIVLVIGGIVEIISVKSGRKQRKYQKMYEASFERMKNKTYAYTLARLGYPVPDQFLNEEF